MGLRGEERLEDPRLGGRVHTDAGVGDSEPHTGAARKTRWLGGDVQVRVSTVTVPPSAMASRALTTRFRSTC